MDEQTSAGIVARTVRRLAYVLVSWVIGGPIALLVLILSIVGVLLGPLNSEGGSLRAAGGIASSAAGLERRMQAALLSRKLRTPTRGAAGALEDRQTWLDIVWAIMRALVCWLAGGVVLLWLGLVAALPITVVQIVAPELYPEPWFRFGTWQPTPATLHLIQASSGLMALLILPAVLGGASRVLADCGAALLGGDGDLARRLGELTASRSAALEAEADQLRRLERDIHDGPQQRLVRLGLDLARAERLIATDPERCAQIIAGSRSLADDTLQELRHLSRRVAPPLLADRGLAAAVQDLVGSASIATEVSIDVPRLAPAVETSAYYVIAEAMTNAHKHSGAARIEVTGSLRDGRLVVAVRDDGRGGAGFAKGHGLRGLQQRVGAHDGTLSVESPAGGPTLIEAVIPCES